MNEIDHNRIKLRKALGDLLRVIRENVHAVEDQEEKAEMLFDDIISAEVSMILSEAA